MAGAGSGWVGVGLGIGKHFPLVSVWLPSRGQRSAA